jgi:thiamine-monophosphate kinase
MIDISDGLISDLYKIIKVSRVGAVIYEDLIPISKDAKSLDEALYMGEDFELLFSLSVDQANRLLEAKKPKDLAKFNFIGEITDRRFGIRFITKKGEEKVLKPKGYTHFS